MTPPKERGLARYTILARDPSDGESAATVETTPILPETVLRDVADLIYAGRFPEITIRREGFRPPDDVLLREAAPDLLQACKDALEEFDHWLEEADEDTKHSSDPEPLVIADIRAAIEKAGHCT